MVVIELAVAVALGPYLLSLYASQSPVTDGDEFVLSLWRRVRPQVMNS